VVARARPRASVVVRARRRAWVDQAAGTDVGGPGKGEVGHAYCDDGVGWPVMAGASPLPHQRLLLHDLPYNGRHDRPQSRPTHPLTTNSRSGVGWTEPRSWIRLVHQGTPALYHVILIRTVSIMGTVEPTRPSLPNACSGNKVAPVYALRQGPPAPQHLSER
jgi:hypothetical protein